MLSGRVGLANELREAEVFWEGARARGHMRQERDRRCCLSM